MSNNLPIRVVTLGGKCFDIKFEGIERRPFTSNTTAVLKRYPRLAALLQDTEAGNCDPEWAAGLIGDVKQGSYLARGIMKEVLIRRKSAVRWLPRDTEFAEVSYLFALTDPAGGVSFRVSVIRKGPVHFYAKNASEYDERLDTVLVNTIRRNVGSLELKFQQPKTATHREIKLEPWDFRPQFRREDHEIRQFMIHAAYWLSHRYGRSYAVRFDSEPDLDYLGVCVDDIARNLSVLEKGGLLISDQPGRGIPTDKLVRAYEDRLFREEAERERVEEIFQEIEQGIEVPVLPLYVTTNTKLGIAPGSAIVVNPHEDIGMCAEAPFPVAVVYYEDNASSDPQLSRYIQRALAAAGNMKRNRSQADTTIKKRHMNADELVKIGLLDCEQKRVFVDDPVALAGWLGVELPPETDLRL